MKRKTADLIRITIIYLLAFVVGVLSALPFEGIFLKILVFDLVATVVTFIFSLVYHNSSVYDAYWSVAPWFMAYWLFVSEKALSFYHLVFLLAFSLWAFRLTANWCVVFTDFTYEDWRYRKFREENNAFLWFIINFFGIHLVPTIVVYLGFLPLFTIASTVVDWKILFGSAVILLGVYLEHSADTSMHAFLEKKTGKTIDEGLWRYTRHPNYLGEITMWLGVALAAAPYSDNLLLTFVGFFAVAFLFNVVSIPLMEKRQLKRRPDYKAYQERTPRLLPIPRRKH